MHQLTNFLYLARETLPIIRIYRSRLALKKSKGKQYELWKKLISEIPDIKRLGDTLHRRMHHYFFANRMTSHWFLTLHQQKPTTREWQGGYYLAAATPIADYMVDVLKYNDQDIRHVLRHPSQDHLENCLCSLHKNAREANAHPDLFDEYLDLTLRAQGASMSQNAGTNGSSKLHQITWAKGGYALLLYRTALSPSIGNQEKDAIYQLGGLMQLHNDLFDLYRDVKEEIQTIPSNTHTIAELREMYTHEIDKTIRLFDRTDTGTSARERFYLLMMIALNTGYICLDQYERLQQQSGGTFNPLSYSREELVCDMDQLSRIWQDIWLTLNWRKPV